MSIADDFDEIRRRLEALQRPPSAKPKVLISFYRRTSMAMGIVYLPLDPETKQFFASFHELSGGFFSTTDPESLRRCALATGHNAAEFWIFQEIPAP